jgi:hypothetical protein
MKWLGRLDQVRDGRWHGRLLDSLDDAADEKSHTAADLAPEPEPDTSALQVPDRIRVPAARNPRPTALAGQALDVGDEPMSSPAERLRVSCTSAWRCTSNIVF